MLLVNSRNKGALVHNFPEMCMDLLKPETVFEKFYLEQSGSFAKAMVTRMSRWSIDHSERSFTYLPIPESRYRSLYRGHGNLTPTVDYSLQHDGGHSTSVSEEALANTSFVALMMRSSDYISDWVKTRVKEHSNVKDDLPEDTKGSAAVLTVADKILKRVDAEPFIKKYPTKWS